LPDGLVEAIYQVPGGPLYFGTTGGAGIYEQGRLRSLEDRRLAGTAVRAIAGDSGGTVYFGTPQGVVARRPDGRSELLPTGSARFRRGVLALQMGPDGTLYAGSDAGLLIYRREKLVRVFAGRPVRSIDEGRNGTIYLASGRGLALYRDGAVLDAARGFEEIVLSVREGADGALYLGTPSSGALFGRPPGPFRPITQDNGLTWGRVNTSHQTRDGTVYFGTDEGVGIYQPHGAIESWTWRTGLPRGAVKSIVEDAHGAIVVSTLWGGARFEDGRWKAEATAAIPDTTLYLGTGKDLVLRRTGRGADQVYSMQSGRDGRLYVGTPRGLAIFREKSFRSDVLTEDTVYCILEDGAGRLYLSTRRGIKVIDPAVSPTAGHTTWTPADGLAGESGMPGACHRDRAGRLWFGFGTGVSVVDPRIEKPGREPPRARISGLELAGQEILPPPAERLLKLASYQKHLTVSFLALELTDPHRVRYRYRLAELDPSWRETTTRAVHFSGLAPGDHIFEVAAAVGAGPWGEPARLRFRVPTPFYRTWWFLMLAPLAAMAVAATVVTWRVRHLLAMERLRTAIAADLHDRIGSGLTEIAILAEIGEPSRVAGIARELTGQLSDVVWLIHPRRDSLYQLFLRLKDTYAELFAEAEILFRTADLSVFERVRLSVTCRQSLYLIFKEALHNALRHASCREIVL
ncbi:MAG TPA: triple tyrosine motif-containing protein, partial [Thermoanaerobaculia bacterium]|nr:triple tyrosine motif-containing protein [Thermoanaerobaculia bacterium]